MAFQSTRPSWGATKVLVSSVIKQIISIHAPLVGRDDGGIEIGASITISIHAPLVGRD